MRSNADDQYQYMQHRQCMNRSSRLDAACQTLGHFWWAPYMIVPRSINGLLRPLQPTHHHHRHQNKGSGTTSWQDLKENSQNNLYVKKGGILHTKHDRVVDETHVAILEK